MKTIGSKSFAVIALAATSLLLASCSSSQDSASNKACLALDTGGVDDKSFNASAWEGAQAAEADGVEVKYLAATSDADYAPNMKKLVDEGCKSVPRH